MELFFAVRETTLYGILCKCSRGVGNFSGLRLHPAPTVYCEKVVAVNSFIRSGLFRLQAETNKKSETMRSAGDTVGREDNKGSLSFSYISNIPSSPAPFPFSSRFSLLFLHIKHPVVPRTISVFFPIFSPFPTYQTSRRPPHHFRFLPDFLSFSYISNIPSSPAPFPFSSRFSLLFLWRSLCGGERNFKFGLYFEVPSIVA